jgi:hypothetical protein
MLPSKCWCFNKTREETPFQMQLLLATWPDAHAEFDNCICLLGEAVCDIPLRMPIQPRWGYVLHTARY